MFDTRRLYPWEERTTSFTLKRGVRRPLALPSPKLWAMKGSHTTGTSAK